MYFSWHKPKVDWGKRYLRFSHRESEEPFPFKSVKCKATKIVRFSSLLHSVGTPGTEYSPHICYGTGYFFMRCMPCPSTSPKLFCASPNFLSQTLNCIYCRSKHFCAHKNWIYWMVWHKSFWTVSICKVFFGLPQKIWTCPEYFGTCRRTRQ